MDAVVVPFVCMTPGDDDSTSIFFEYKLNALLMLRFSSSQNSGQFIFFFTIEISLKIYGRRKVILNSRF